MAKPTVTEKDVSEGIASLGGFGGLTKQASSARRDSPFGTNYAKSPPQKTPVATNSVPTDPVPAAETKAAPLTVINVTPPANLADLSLKSAPSETTGNPVPPPSSAETPAAAIEESALRPPELPVVATTPVKPTPQKALRQGQGNTPPQTSPSIPKTELFSERVTVLMDSEMRDELNRVAHLLQRRKTASTERITANTLMRVAIKVFLEELEPADTDTPNTELELYRLTKSKVRRRG
jgi:hypothetical protein